MKELPFVVGVLGDFTGNPEQPLPKLKERRFVEVTPDNFDSVLESMKPHLSFAVENKLSEDSDAGQIKVDLRFEEPGRLRTRAGSAAGEAAQGIVRSPNAPE